MRRLPSLLIALLFVVITAAPGGAIELRNHDPRGYTVAVKSKRTRTTVRLNPRSASLVVCVGTCTFRVPGVGRVRARGDDVVIIEGRSLRKRVAAAE